jgi:hypothetical protein
MVSFKDRPRANRGAFLQIGFLISGHRGVAQGGKFFSPNSIGVCNQLDCNQSIHQCKKHYRLTVSPDLSDNNPDNSSFYPLAPIFTLKPKERHFFLLLRGNGLTSNFSPHRPG